MTLRSKSPIQTLLVAGAALALPLAVVPAASTAKTAPSPSGARAVVATGLDNPRQITYKKGVGFLVAEAGVGGGGPCMPGPEGGPVCYGNSGAITRIRGGNQTRIVKRLPSLASEGTGEGAIGPSDVIPYGKHRIAFTIGLGADPAVRADLPRKGRWMAGLFAAKLRGGEQHGKLTWIADLGAFEAKANPHKTAPDSNPVSLVRKKKRFFVTDAGGNTWLRVRRNGNVKALAVFQDRSFNGSDEFQAVPTSVAKGPDGAYYISQLTGFPFVKDAAQIYRVRPGGTPKVYASGLTNVTDLAWYRGALYAVQISDEGLASGGPPIGSLRQVVPGGSTHPVVAGGLFAPYGVAFKNNTAFVTTCAVCPNDGEVQSFPLN